jgi:hypothetical protein
MDRRRPALSIASMALAVIVAAPVAAANNYPDPDSLLENGTFNTAPAKGDPVPHWKLTSGKLRVERFGTRSFPNVAYGKKYRGGARYLSCWGGSGGTITQRVSIPKNRVGREWRAKFQVSQGGIRGHRVFVRAEALDGNGKVVKEEHQTKVLDITNHYKKSFAGVGLWPGTETVRVTLRLMPKKGSTSCKVIADTANLTIVRA